MTEIGEIIRGVIDYTAPSSSEQLNIFHWILSDATTTDADVLASISNWAENDWGPAWQDLAADSAELLSIKLDVVDENGLILRAIGTTLLSLVGGNAGGVVSAAVSAYMLLKTVRPKIRGVKYVPCMADALVDEGSLDAGAFIDLAFLLIQYGVEIDGLVAGKFIPGVVSSALTAFEPFLDTGIIENIPAYQRRRKPNVGS